MPIRFKRSLCVIFLLVLGFTVHGAVVGPRQAAALPAVGGNISYPDSSSFAAELQRIGIAIEKEKANPAGLAAVRMGLPSHWEVTAGNHRYNVSADALSGLLRAAEGGKNAKNIADKAGEAAEWAFDLASQAKAYAGAQTGGDSSARPVLQRILSGREFGSVKGPSSWDLFRQRAVRWIENLLLRILGQIGRYPMGATILFWFIVVAVVVWLALVLFRYWTRHTALDELQAPDSVTYVRTWQEWIQAAREAATRRDFREAVHS